MRTPELQADGYFLSYPSALDLSLYQTSLIESLSMMEFVNECINIVNLPFTILAILVCVYWVFVILGIIGFEAFDIDLDADWDAS